MELTKGMVGKGWTLVQRSWTAGGMASAMRQVSTSGTVAATVEQSTGRSPKADAERS
jgi:hypothetical protein